MVLGIIEGQSRGGYFPDYILDPSVIDCNTHESTLQYQYYHTPWVSGSPNQTLGEPQIPQLLCVTFSSSAQLADWYYVMIM